VRTTILPAKGPRVAARAGSPSFHPPHPAARSCSITSRLWALAKNPPWIGDHGPRIRPAPPAHCSALASRTSSIPRCRASYFGRQLAHVADAQRVINLRSVLSLLCLDRSARSPGFLACALPRRELRDAKLLEVSGRAQIPARQLVHQLVPSPSIPWRRRERNARDCLSPCAGQKRPPVQRASPPVPRIFPPPSRIRHFAAA